MRYSTFAVMTAMVAASGCVSVLPEPTTPEALYRLDAAAPQALPATVMIREPEAPQIMAGRAMVREDLTGAMRLVPDIEWAGRATRLMQLALVDSFQGGEGGAVLPESGVGASYEFSVRLTTLGFVGDRAVCEGTATLLDTRTRELVHQDRIERDRAAPDSDPRDLKAVSEDCVADFADMLVTAISSK